MKPQSGWQPRIDRRKEAKSNGSPRIAEPTLWKSDQNDNAKLKRELDICEKENRSLNNLIAHTGVASAQTSTTATTDKANSSAMMHKEGQWRSSKLIGIDVYNGANEKVGNIEELILDKSGKVEDVVLGVGGFLGMGEHYVAVTFDKLKWVNEPVRSTTASTAPAGTRPATNVDSNARTAADGTAKTTTGSAATTTRPVRDANEQWYPDHAVLNATKDQLKAMTQFKYN